MQGDSKKSVEFLKKWKPEGPWVLTSISTDRKGITTTTFSASEEKEMLSWLNKFNGERNIYFSVNTVKGKVTSKANKEDIESAEWLHVDIDPADGQDIKEERERALSSLTDRLPKGIPEPTTIVFSGGGFQAFWKLKTPVKIDGDIAKAEDFELYNKRLEQIFGGDHCHNVDRIMRLPGTVNIPDAKKRKKGRVEELAALLQFTPKSYDLDDFKKAAAVQISNNGSGRDGGDYGQGLDIPGNVERILDLSELDQWNVPDRVKVIVAQGMHPDQPKKDDNSRSAWLFDCVCSLIRCGVPDAVIYSLITDADWGIASSVVELKGGADRYARRQIKRAKEYCEDPNLTSMNDRHAVIGNIGGKCRVIEEINDEVLHRSRITLSSFEDIRNRYGHVQVQVGTTDKGLPIMQSLGKYWLNSPNRRQYDTMKFMPQGDKLESTICGEDSMLSLVPATALCISTTFATMCALVAKIIMNMSFSGWQEQFRHRPRLEKWQSFFVVARAQGNRCLQRFSAVCSEGTFSMSQIRRTLLGTSTLTYGTSFRFSPMRLSSLGTNDTSQFSRCSSPKTLSRLRQKELMSRLIRIMST